jgi:hypothetical protein
MIMIDYDRIVSVIMRRTGKSRDEAWDGLMEAYLTVDRNRSEPEQASYLIINGSLKALMDNYDTVHKATVFECEMSLSGLSAKFFECKTYVFRQER